MIDCNKHGRDCFYASAKSNTVAHTCDFLLITGKRRGCKPTECDKYIKGKRIRKGGHNG